MRTLPPTVRRRTRTLLTWLALGLLPACGSSSSEAVELPYAIGTRLELFVDDTLGPRFGAGAIRVVHRPEPQEVVLVTGEPWEGNSSAYFTVLRDGDIFRMYYRASQTDLATGTLVHGEHTGYAESADGITWVKPSLGRVSFAGSTDNNIVWDGIGTHCFTVFVDDNPDAPADARYKAVSWGLPRGVQGLYVFGSPDGIQWRLLSPGPVIQVGDFDSQNVAFWDAEVGLYRAYWRLWIGDLRTIMTATSEDFIRWSAPTVLRFPDVPTEQLYTNAVRPYVRAPHILLGFPTRILLDQGSSVEPTLMASRDGVTFTRWLPPLIRRTDPEDRSGNRSNYMGWGMVEIPGRPDHLSMYATEAYLSGTDTRIRRFEYRKDGFVSIQGGAEGGEVVTRLLTVDPTASSLQINAVAQTGGSVRVGFETEDGTPVPGFSLDDAVPFTGDDLDHVLAWAGGSDLTALRGRSLRLRFRMVDADVYALQFRP